MNDAIMIIIMKNCNDFQVHRCIECTREFITKDSVPTCLFVINISFVFEMFSESLFAVSQSITFVIA